MQLITSTSILDSEGSISGYDQHMKNYYHKMYTDSVYSTYKDCQREDCKTKTTLRCIRCRKVFYCSKKCQRKDWKLHKSMCNK